MTLQETFVARLRRHRERRRISLDDIAAATRIRRESLEAFEGGDLTEWPRGIYARAWVRGYATAVGLDPIDTVDEFCRLFSHGDRRAAGTFREFAAIIAHPSTYTDEFEHAVHGDRRQPPAQGDVVEEPPAWRDHVLRVMRGLRPARTARTVRTTHSN